MKIIFTLILCTVTLLQKSLIAETVNVKSPDSNIEATVSIPDNGKITYEINFYGKRIFTNSQMGIILSKGDIGTKTTFIKEERCSANTVYKTRGVHSEAHNHYNAVSLFLHDETTQTDFTIELRVFNDAVAYRYILPEKQVPYEIKGELSCWCFAFDCPAWCSTAGYEGNIRKYQLSSLLGEKVFPPITAVLPGGDGYVCLTEANLVGYSGATFISPEKLKLQIALNAPLKQNKRLVTPWRVAILAKTLTALVNTDAVKNLCPPPCKELADADWIRPGRSVWSWWSSNTVSPEKQKKYADYAEALGFEYNLIDWKWPKWENPWGAIADIVAYSKKHGVNVWLWRHSKKLKTPQARKEFFSKAVSAGIVGLKIDFLPPENANTVKFYNDILKEAAEYKLMINFHGANKPTGRSRTWPNEMTREGIRGHEWRMKGRYKMDSQHDAALPFTRFIAGPGDYTPTAFNPERLDGYSWAHELAQPIVFTSPVIHYAEDPVYILKNPSVEILKAIPSIWDKTVVLPGSRIGEVAAFARQTGKIWFIGILNNEKAKDFSINLSFLPAGEYKMEILEDDESSPAAFKQLNKTVTGKDQISIKMRSKGGFAARISPR